MVWVVRLLMCAALLLLPAQATEKDSIVSFSKRLYQGMATRNATSLTHDFKKEYAALESAFTKKQATLGESLVAILDMHVADLQASVQHARKMQTVLHALAA